jgi:hypothetical protein
MRKVRLFILSCYSEGVRHCHLCLADYQRLTEERKRFKVEKRLIGDCSHGDAVGEITRSGAAKVIG